MLVYAIHEQQSQIEMALQRGACLGSASGRYPVSKKMVPGVRTKALGGDAGSSIKVVLPTLAPKMTYEDMEIGEGQTASLAFGDMVDGRVAGENLRATRKALLDYCRLDTQAMVTIVEKLRALLDE